MPAPYARLKKSYLGFKFFKYVAHSSPFFADSRNRGKILKAASSFTCRFVVF